MTTITRLKIENFGGIRSLEIRPGQQTILAGENGAGKTAVLEAIRAALTNYRNRTVLVHDETNAGHLLFELSNGMRGSREITNEGRTAGRLSLSQDGESLRQPEKALQALVGPGFALNPVAFLALSEDEQREAILRVTEIDLPREEAIRLSGGELLDINYGAHPLMVLKAIEESLYLYRRDVNRDALHRRHAAKKLREAVDGEVDTDLLRGFNLESAIAKLTRTQDATRDLTAAHRRSGEIDAQIASLQDELIRKQGEIEKLQVLQVDPAPIRADIELFKTQQDDWRKLQQANDEDQAAETLETQSENLTALIQETRGKPADLLKDAKLPVEGLAITEAGKITIKGLPISDLSTGEKLAWVAVPIAIATLPPKDKGIQIVLIDGVEALDEANRKGMFAQLHAAGVQVLAAQVGEGELTVITDYINEDTFEAAAKKRREVVEVLDDEIPF